MTKRFMDDSELAAYQARRGQVVDRSMQSDDDKLEDQLCKDFWRWRCAAVATYPQLLLLHHVPNGGKRNKATAANLKSMGVLPGIPDYHLPVSRSGYHSLYIEFKTASGRVSATQRDIHKLLADEGNLIVIVRSVAYAIRDTVAYLTEQWANR